MESILIRIRIERRRAIQHFLLGVFSFLASAVTTAWCYWQGPSAIAVTVVCTWGAWHLKSMETSMRTYFKAPPIFTSRLFGTHYDPHSEPLLGDLMSQEQLKRDLAANTAAQNLGEGLPDVAAPPGGGNGNGNGNPGSGKKGKKSNRMSFTKKGKK